MAKEKYSLIGILILGILLRLVNLNQSLWLDEAAQAVLSRGSLAFIWAGRMGDFHPPLFYFLAHFWQLLGTSDIWLRLLPVFFGVLTIPVIYLLARSLLPDFKPAGHLSAFFLAIAPFHIYYSQEYRSYSLLCLLGSLSLLLLIRRRYIWLALVNAALLYTHYSSVFLVLSQLVYILFLSRRDLKPYLAGLLVSLLLYLPWLPHLFVQLNSGINIDSYLPGWKSVLSVAPLKALPLILFKLVAGRINLLPNYIYYLYIVFVLGFTFFSLLLFRSKRPLLLVWLFVPIFSMLLISLVLPQNQPFRVIYILPALLLVFVSACRRFPKLIFTLVLYISLVGNFLYFTRPRLQREEWRQALSFISSRPAPLLVKFSDKFAPITWYAPRLEIIPVLQSFPARSDQVSAVLSSRLSGLHQIYLMNYLTDLTDPHRLIDSTLVSQNWSLEKTYNFEGVGFISAYVKP